MNRICQLYAPNPLIATDLPTLRRRRGEGMVDATIGTVALGTITLAGALWFPGDGGSAELLCGIVIIGSTVMLASVVSVRGIRQASQATYRLEGHARRDHCRNWCVPGFPYLNLHDSNSAQLVSRYCEGISDDLNVMALTLFVSTICFIGGCYFAGVDLPIVTGLGTFFSVITVLFGVGSWKTHIVVTRALLALRAYQNNTQSFAQRVQGLHDEHISIQELVDEYEQCHIEEM
jgi:hypothetical protein